MHKHILLFWLCLGLASCKRETNTIKMSCFRTSAYTNIPVTFEPNTIPGHRLIHKGIFSPDLKQYYYTLSDPDFTNFDIYSMQCSEGKWSVPQETFFNSEFDDHGMSFSPDGQTIYFSSTRPVLIPGIEVAPTWHIWKTQKVNDEWTEPAYVDIPNLRNKLTSHPVLTRSGMVYFHSGNPDYSEMDIYRSRLVENKFENAEKITFSTSDRVAKCTPYVSPDEDFLIYAAIGDQLDLFISFNDGKGTWTQPNPLSEKINQWGQGNPWVTSDKEILLYTTGDHQGENWKIMGVNIQAELQRD